MQSESAPTAEQGALSPVAVGCSAGAFVGALLPLLTHRLLELLSLRVAVRPWNAISLHLLPPLGMIASSIALWRSAPPLPSDPRLRMLRQPALAIAAGLLLGALAAIANLLSLLAGASSGAGAVSPVFGFEAGALVLHVALLAPIAEEMAFRGLLYRHLRRVMLPLAASALSAALFAVMHASLGQSVWAFFLGLITAFAYEQTRSVATPMLVHGLFNAVPVGVAVVRSRPGDVGPLWLVLLGVGVAFSLAARRAGQATRAV